MNDFEAKGQGFFDELTKRGIPISEEQKKRIQDKLNSILNYQPRIGVFGKSGNGKSSICNALFGQNICEISDVAACTRNTKEVLLNMGSRGLTLLDVPGIGESESRDNEYAKLYSKLLPELDVVLWVLKADDRAYSSDEAFYKSMIKPHMNEGKPIFFVINQCDKIEPYHEWNRANHRPSVNQFSNIHQKIEIVSKYFNVTTSKIIAISAKEEYNLSKLIDEIVYALPREKKITFLRGTREENRSDNAVTVVKKAWYEILGEVVTSIVNGGIEIVLKAIEKSGNFIENLFGKLFKWAE